MFVSSTPETAQDSPTSLEKIASGDHAAVTECVRTHGNWIWSFALKHSDSTEAAEQLTMNIFQSVWKFANRYRQSGLDEKTFISVIVRRELRGKPIPNDKEFGADNKFYKPYKKYSDRDGS